MQAADLNVRALHLHTGAQVVGCDDHVDRALSMHHQAAGSERQQSKEGQIH